MQEHILEIKNLTKYYGKVKGVENLSLTIDGGEIFGFIGPNGAGKSTTIRSVMNLINKNSGTVYVCGKEFLKDDTETKRKIGYLPSEVFLYDDLNVGALFDYHESFYAKHGDGKAIHERRCELVERLKLDESKMIEDLSLGNLKKTGIILALMHKPKLVIMDEPTKGVDVGAKAEIYAIMGDLAKQGFGIIMISSEMPEILGMCDRVYVMCNGRMTGCLSREEATQERILNLSMENSERDGKEEVRK